MKLLTSLTGEHIVLNTLKATDFPPEVAVGTQVEVQINGVWGTGYAVQGGDWFIRMNESIAAPKGSCVDYELKVTCDDLATDPENDAEVCLTTEVTDLADVKLAVLDENNCPVAHITMGKLLTYLEANLTPAKLCDQVSSLPETPTADMRVLAISGDCTLASVAVAGFGCTMSEPEDFSCE